MRKAKTNRKMTLATLVVALAVAVYLNWEYARSADLALDAAAPAAGDAAEEPVVDELPVQAQPSASRTYGEAQLVSASAASSQSFFEEARLARTKARDEAMDSLQKSLKKASLTEQEKTDLTARLYPGGGRNHSGKRCGSTDKGQGLCGLRGVCERRQGKYHRDDQRRPLNGG